MLPKFLRDISETISQKLCELFSKSSSKGVFHDHMKLVMVTPIYKGKSKLEISSNRPASVLLILSKVLEKLIFNRLVKLLKLVTLTCEVIYKHQYDFQKSKSTIHAVFDIHTRIVKALDQGNLTCNVY